MRRRVFAIIAICAIYLLVDANLISVIYPIVSLKTMWMYYDHQAVVLLSAVLIFLNALNLFVFIYYMVEMILNQMSEKKRILSLNEELAQKNEQLLIQARQLEAATQTKERNRLAREIQMVIDNAHKAGIWAGICGELGADTSLTNIFIKMGIDELSVSPGCILPVRKAIRDAE